MGPTLCLLAAKAVIAGLHRVEVDGGEGTLRADYERPLAGCVESYAGQLRHDLVVAGAALTYLDSFQQGGPQPTSSIDDHQAGRTRPRVAREQRHEQMLRSRRAHGVEMGAVRQVPAPYDLAAWWMDHHHLPGLQHGHEPVWRHAKTAYEADVG